MKIAFYLPNKGLKDIDCRDLEHGNPGIGGTEYIIQATAHYILKLHPSSLEIVVGANETDMLSPDLNTVKISDIQDLVGQTSPDYLLLKYEPSSYKEARRAVDGTKTQLLLWTHNFVPRKELTGLANDIRVKRIICVSREQLNMYRDHKAFLKSSYIYNGMPVEYMKILMPELPALSERPHEVTYIGSIVDYKGFHLLAKAWPEVLKKVPDAKLNVIGSGKLYDRNAKLGKYGIAEESYECQFMPYLTDSNGKILPSVKFWGVLGIEKNDVLKQTKVGIPNPSGISETFCITALEMQAMGCLVTTIDFGGFRNTVYRKTGLLYKNPKDLARCISDLLKAKDNDINGFYDFMGKQFAFEKIAKDWINLLLSLKKENETLSYDNREHDFLMSLREWNRKVKAWLPFGYCLPTIDFYRSILRRFGLVKGF